MYAGQTFQRSRSLLGASTDIVRQHPALVVLPILGAILSAIAGALFAIPIFMRAQGFAADRTIDLTELDKLAVANGVVYFFFASLVLMFINQFFEAAVVHGAYCRLVGQTPTVGASLRWTSGKIVALAPWVLVHTIVNSLVRKGSRGGVVARLLSGGIGMSWKMATFIVLPILVVEELGPKQAFHRSRELMAGRYGMSATATFGFAVIGWVMAFACGTLMALSSRLGGVGVGVAALALIVLVCGTMLLSTLIGVYRAAFYYFAVSGQEPPGFEATEMAHAFA